MQIIMLYNIIHVHTNIHVDMSGGKKIPFCKIELLDKHNTDWLKATSTVHLLGMHDIHVYIIGYSAWELHSVFLHDIYIITTLTQKYMYRYNYNSTGSKCQFVINSSPNWQLRYNSRNRGIVLISNQFIF